MRLITRRELHETGDSYFLLPFGDMHLGSANCDKTLAWRIRDWIKQTPNARWIGMGDYCEWISSSDRRWDPRDVDTKIVNLANLHRLGDVYIEKLTDFFEPIIGQAWAIGDGNHEEAFQKYNATAIVPRVLESLGADPDLYSEWTCSTRIIFSDSHRHRSIWMIWHEHGWQAGRTRGAKRNEMAKVPAYWPGHDIYLRGHSHDPFAEILPAITPSSRHQRLEDKPFFVGHAGSCLKTYEKNVVSYAERGGYPPVALGFPYFIIYPGRNTRGRLVAVIGETV